VLRCDDRGWFLARGDAGQRVAENGVVARAHIIVVNRDPTYIDADADVVFREDVAEALPLIAAACAAKNGGETRNPKGLEDL